ncbi:MAG: immunity 8 family protein [Anaeromyxobacter sp.]|nr:immunity 8 family protein [Anaeromyxobacter sp.]MBL0276679.1 immunity 8 family protein [Anaeromyxobacter sp.]
MRARLKSLRCDDIPDLAAWAPPVPDSFAVPLVLEVGALGLKGRERFDLLAVTPRWLQERHGADGAVLGRGLLLVFSWDLARIRRFLSRQVEGCSGHTWPEVARRVSRIALWEGDHGNVVGLE